MAYSETKRHAHELIDRMAPGQVAAVVGLLEVMLDPLALTLAAAPYDDEPLDEDSFASERDQSVAHDKVLDELGLTSEDFARMGRTPLVS